MSAGIKITAVDLLNGDTGERVIDPGDYCLIAAEPLYLVGEQRHNNGTITLTLKRRSIGDFDPTDLVRPDATQENKT